MMAVFRAVSATVLLIALSHCLSGCFYRRAYDENFYRVIANNAALWIMYAEFEYWIEHGSFCDYPELYSTGSRHLGRFDAQGLDEHGIQYSVSVASDGKSFTVNSSIKGFSWTKSWTTQDAEKYRAELEKAQP